MSTAIKDRAAQHLLQDDSPADNAFCATGAGGGIDPTCGSGGSKSSSVKVGQLVKIKLPHPTQGSMNAAGTVKKILDDGSLEIRTQLHGYHIVKPSDIVQNEQEDSLEFLTANLSGKVRREEIDGRKYLVAPLRMIVPGVLNGSKGPLHYPSSEIARNFDSWNGIPIVVNHPTDESGKAISARHPRVWRKQGIGHVYETVYNGSLDAEGWFDVAKTNKVDPRIIPALEQGRGQELSTGLFTDNEPAQNGAAWNGKPYSFVARNYRPDHLAILPDSTGACSMKDGCGVLVNEEKKTIWNRLGEALGITSNVDGDNKQTGPAKKCKCGGTCEECSKVEPLKTNQSGSDDVDEPNHNDEGEPAMAKLTAEQKTALVDNLVANCDCDEKKAKAKTVLNSLNDEQFELVVNMAPKSIPKKGAKAKDGEDQWPTDEEEGEEAGRAAKAAARKKGITKNQDDEQEEETPVTQVTNKGAPRRAMTDEEYLELLPPRMRSVVQNGMAFEQRQREDLIEKIVANDRNQFSEEYLAKLGQGPNGLEVLQGLAALADDKPIRNEAQPIYLGAAAPSSLVRNAIKADDDQEMAPAAWDWSNDRKKAS